MLFLWKLNSSELKDIISELDIFTLSGLLIGSFWISKVSGWTAFCETVDGSSGFCCIFSEFWDDEESLEICVPVLFWFNSTVIKSGLSLDETAPGTVFSGFGVSNVGISFTSCCISATFGLIISFRISEVVIFSEARGTVIATIEETATNVGFFIIIPPPFSIKYLIFDYFPNHIS